MTDVEYARAFFEKDYYASEASGIVIEEAAPGQALVSCVTERRHKNASGRVMGAVYTTMADFAFAVAANYGNPVTVSLNIQASFLAPARGRKLFARAEKIRDGRGAAFYEVFVSDELETDIARVQVTGYKMKPLLPPYTPEEGDYNPYREQMASLKAL
ncbi:MAG: PaaI family thioesterase [Lachnospiraceae bacterium]|nr:PaaI family thioesterase [Lachnospiraceae bacterium]